ncbi:protein TUNAR isoform X1 [Haliaeetus albicilla]|uniref:protein TUNAR isoform X1 n=1 Tax=Haliaeetus albicilla TaxID=8969 RepID=UPI0037E77086
MDNSSVLDAAAKNRPLSCVNGVCTKDVSQVILKGRIKKLATKMVITSGNEEDKGSQEKESKEETILAMLGIIGTILNLIVIIFVYIYTTL